MEVFTPTKLRDIMGSHGLPEYWPDLDENGEPFSREPIHFESQPAYLDRHRLFLPNERRRLDAEDFLPEVLNYETSTDDIPEARRAEIDLLQQQLADLEKKAADIRAAGIHSQALADIEACIDRRIVKIAKLRAL
jgi:hypothetical protein